MDRPGLPGQHRRPARHLRPRHPPRWPDRPAGSAARRRRQLHRPRQPTARWRSGMRPDVDDRPPRSPGRRTGSRPRVSSLSRWITSRPCSTTRPSTVCTSSTVVRKQETAGFTDAGFERRPVRDGDVRDGAVDTHGPDRTEWSVRITRPEAVRTPSRTTSGGVVRTSRHESPRTPCICPPRKI